ncbi:MAG: response regulator [bacterium]
MEDDPTHDEAIRRAFEGAGTPSRIRLARSLREFRSTVEACPPDIALLDLDLPDGSAIEALTSPPEAGPFPVLIMTSSGNEQAAVEVMKSGALDYVVKSPNAFADMPRRVAGALREWNLLLQRKRSEEALRESEERYRDLVEHSTDTICTHDLEGNLLSANEAAFRLTGYPRKALRRANLRDLLDPKVRDEFDAYLSEIREKGRAGGIMQILTAGGETRYWEFSNTLRTEGVAAPIVRGTARDVTDRVLAEKAVRKSRKEFEALSREFHAILDAIPDHITRLSPALGVIWANRAAAAEVNGEPANFSDCRCFRLRSNLDRPYERCPVLRTFRTGEPDYEIIVSPDRKMWEVRTIPVKENDRVVNVIEVGRDITEHRRLEEHLRHARKMEAVGRLAGGVAHDFNNMLNVILGYCEIAMTRLDPDTPLARDLQEIRKAAERSVDLTRQLLAFSRKQVAVPKVVRLNEAIAEQMNMLGRMIGEDIRIDFLPSGDLWNIRIDPSQVAQILANLGVNARDAIAGVGAITIETHNATLDEVYCLGHDFMTPGEYAVIAFSDTGAGMDPATLERIFEPFFTTKEVGKGTGLGLSTVYGIVKQNGGIINAYSEPGIGTTFRIYFPRVREDAAEAAETGRKDAPMGAEIILLVEDEKQILFLAARILEGHGYRVLSAESPEEACRIAEQYDGKIDLLLTDVVMPGMNGKELQGRIAAMRPGIRVLYMSGYTANAIAHRGVLDEGVAFVQKPFTMRALLEKVRSVLDS